MGELPALPSPPQPGAQRSVPFSASGGHQSLHIAGWMLLETKEEDFGCQFVLTLCKVCLEAKKAGYRPDSGCALFWLFCRTGWGPMVVHIPQGWGPRFWCLLYLRVQPTGSSGLGEEVPGVRPDRTRSFLHPCPTRPGSCIHQRNKRCRRIKASEEDRR